MFIIQQPGEAGQETDLLTISSKDFIPRGPTKTNSVAAQRGGGKKPPRMMCAYVHKDWYWSSGIREFNVSRKSRSNFIYYSPKILGFGVRIIVMSRSRSIKIRSHNGKKTQDKHNDCRFFAK